MDNTAEKWNARAGDYQKVFKLGQNDYNNSVLDFWETSGMLQPGMRVLDIGCGVGKYGVCLARRGYDVTLTDISSEMLRHAENNMKPFGTPWRTYCCDFAEASGREPVFAGGFDFSISTMSPAVCDVETVKKMSGMTRGWCFLSRFFDWQQPFRDTLIHELGLEPRPLFKDLKGDCAGMIKAVQDAGFEPQYRYKDYNWFDERTPEQMADYMCRYYFSDTDKREELLRETLRLAKAHAGPDNTVIDNVNTKTVWIYWKTGEKA